MAAAVRNGGAWGTGGLEELVGSGGSPIAQQVVTDIGPWALEFAPALSRGIARVSIHTDGSAAANDIIITSRIRFSDVTPTDGNRFLSIKSGTDQLHCGVGMDTDAGSNRLSIIDANGTAIAAVNDKLTAGTWYTITLRMERAASGAAKVWVDDVEILSVTGQDFLNGTLQAQRGEFQGWDNSAGNTTMYVAGWHIQDGVTADSERHGHAAAGYYQQTGEDATDLGTPLDTGTWALVSETPLDETRPGNVGEYTGGVSSGSMRTDTDFSNARPGPSGDGDITGAIIAMKGVYRLARGGGSATTFEVIMGNSGDGSANYLKTAAPLTTTGTTYEHISESALVVPLSSEFAEIGMAKDGGGRGMIAGEMWAVVLHVPSTAPPPTGPPVGTLALTGVGI